jgi:hypothetical protein
MNAYADKVQEGDDHGIRANAASAGEDPPVGYGSAPRQHRFKKGQSGNKAGRKKGSRNMLSVFKDVACEKIKVKIGGEVRKMTRMVYVVWANYYAARKKNQKALNNIMMLAEECGLFIDRDDFNKAGAAIAHSQPLTFEQFDALFGNSHPVERAPNAAGKPATKH